MATFTLTASPGAAYVGTDEDDTFLVPSHAAWVAAGRTIIGAGGFDTLVFLYRPLGTPPETQYVTDAAFAGVSGLEALTHSPPPGGSVQFYTLGPLAASAFSQGVAVTGYLNLFASELTVPVTFSEGGLASVATVRTGLGHDIIMTTSFMPVVNSGPGDDRISLLSQFNTPFTGNGSVFGGTGYDILIGVGPGTAVTATAQGQVNGIEEIWTSTRFNLLLTTPTALTGLDGNGARNPLVLQPNGGGLNVHASDDGRPSYDGRLIAFGAPGADIVRGSSVADWLDGGTGGADSLAGEGGNDILVLENAGHAAGAVALAGGAGYDILALRAGDGTVNDAAFGQVGSIEEFYLLGGGNQVVNLGANSDAAFAASNFGAGSVSAPRSLSFTLNAATTSRALSIYGSGVETIRAGRGNDFIEVDGSGADSVFAGDGADHLRFASGLGLGGEYDGGAGYDVLLLGTGAMAELGAPTPGATPVLRRFEEMRFTGNDAISLTLAGQSVFQFSETGTGTIQAPNAAALAIDLRDVTLGLSVYGTAGADVITATATARDYLAGGAGADIFRFDRASGIDTLADFASGTDRIALIGFAGVADFAAVQARASVVAGHTMIVLSPTDTVFLANVTAIAAGDFIFG